MDTKKWIPVMAVVLFLGASSPVEACRCLCNHLQCSYCTADVVLKVQFHEASTRPGPGHQPGEKGYNMKVSKVLKGKVGLKSTTFTGTMAGSDCEYVHTSTDVSKEYLITASNDSGKISVGSCSSIVTWHELSNKQKTGVEGAYNKGCSCKIVSCSAKPCPTQEKTCSLEEYPGGKSEKQRKNQACVPSTGTSCKWQDL